MFGEETVVSAVHYAFVREVSASMAVCHTVESVSYMVHVEYSLLVSR